MRWLKQTAKTANLSCVHALYMCNAVTFCMAEKQWPKVYRMCRKALQWAFVQNEEGDGCFSRQLLTTSLLLQPN